MEGQTSAADMEASKDGPVLTMINKRLRALRKKYNKILLIEENKAQGKHINKEQEDVLKGKSAVGVLIEEYEKLKPALKEELAKEILEIRLNNEEEGAGGDVNPCGFLKEKESTDARVEEYDTREDVEAENAGIERVPKGDVSRAEGPFIEKSSYISEDDGFQRMELLESGMVPFQREINDLLHLIYFSQLFDVPLADASPSVVWTKIHERSSCVSYDCVTEEDASSPLEEGDLNNLSLLGSLITSRLPNSTLSHQEALQQCTRHALLWLTNSDAPIRDGDRVTYLHLRERLGRILSSEYYTMIPELQTIGQQSMAAAAGGSGQYPPQVLIDAALTGAAPPFYYASQEAASESLLQGGHYTAALPAVRNLDLATPLFGMNAAAEYVPESDASPQGDIEAVTSYTRIEEEQPQDLESVMSKHPHTGTGHQPEGQQQELEPTNLHSDLRPYQSLNGGVGQSSNHFRAKTTMNSRGYGIGRGGSGNGRGNQFNDQGAYFPRNQNGRANSRGTGAVGSSNFNGYANGQASNRTNSAAPV